MWICNTYLHLYIQHMRLYAHICTKQTNVLPSLLWVSKIFHYFPTSYWFSKLDLCYLLLTLFNLSPCHADIFKVFQVLCFPLVLQMLFQNRIQPPHTPNFHPGNPIFTVGTLICWNTSLRSFHLLCPRSRTLYKYFSWGIYHIVLWFICFLFVPCSLSNILSLIIMS